MVSSLAHGHELPPKSILIWHGTIATIPDGFALCDGNNGTPDLTDRFVVGAGDTYDPGDTGGAATHTHDSGSLSTGGPSASSWTQAQLGIQVATNVHTHDVDSGSTDTASSLPPYYALAFIMKL